MSLYVRRYLLVILFMHFELHNAIRLYNFQTVSDDAFALQFSRSARFIVTWCTIRANGFQSTYRSKYTHTHTNTLFSCCGRYKWRYLLKSCQFYFFIYLFVFLSLNVLSQFHKIFVTFHFIIRCCCRCNGKSKAVFSVHSILCLICVHKSHIQYLKRNKRQLLYVICHYCVNYVTQKAILILFNIESKMRIIMHFVSQFVYEIICLCSMSIQFAPIGIRIEDDKWNTLNSNKC